MPVEFSITDQSIIKNMMLQKSAKEISRLLDCKTQDVADFIKNAVHGTNIVTHQMKIEAKHPAKKTVEKRQTISRAKIKKQEAALQIRITEEKIKLKSRRQVEDDRKRRQPSMYKSKNVDYSKLITIKIDAKTYIYANPGDNIEKVKSNFLKTYKKSFK